MRSGSVTEPLVPWPAVFSGAPTTTGRTTIGLRTVCPRRSSQDSAPNAQLPNAAVVRFTVTLYVADLPGPTTITDGLTVTVKPAGACTLATYVLDSFETLVTVRVT